MDLAVLRGTRLRRASLKTACSSDTRSSGPDTMDPPIDPDGTTPSPPAESSRAPHRSNTASRPLATDSGDTPNPPPSVPPAYDNALRISGAEAPPALRRSSSTLSSGSASAGGKKRLRFTPLTPGQAEEAGPSQRRDDGKRGISRDQQDYLKSDPGTPNLRETADGIRRTLSLANLDSLLSITRNEAGERERLLAEVTRAGRDLVWRSSSEKRLFPGDAERAVVLAFKGALRSFILAFSVRAGFNLLLMLLRRFRRKGIRLALVLHAVFGVEPFRFAGMIGTFTFLNTLTLHLLRLSPPLSYLRRRLRAGLFSKATFGPPERDGPEGERRWQAAAAGAVGSLGLLWETKARRTGVAQQMFVRGLAGSYNQYAPQVGIHIPHGAVLIFGLACGQIMYSWLAHPETLPDEYNRWILSASRVPDFALEAKRSILASGKCPPQPLRKAMATKDLTATNRARLTELLRKVEAGWLPTGALPCEVVHPKVNGCNETNLRRFFEVFRFMLPVYSALHLVPLLVLRRHSVKKEPLKMLMRVMWGITRSCSFLGAFVFIFHYALCLRTQTIYKLSGGWLRDILQRKQWYWMMGFSTCLSLFLEEKRRRAELAMYVLPRALESAWSSARKRAWVPLVPFGETILGAAAMAMVMDAYKHKPDALSGVVRRLLFQLVGPV